MQASVTAGSLNVRREAGTAADRVGTLGRGTRVEVLGRSGSWYEVADGALRGFVHGDYLRFDDVPERSGFLCHDDELCQRELHPPAAHHVHAPARGAVDRMVAETWNRYGGMLTSLCDTTSLPRSAAVAVLCVESGGTAMGPDGRLIIRFENHVFWDKWGARHPDAFRRHFTFDSSKRWTGHRIRTADDLPWRPSHAGGQDAEWRSFEVARRLHEPAALLSISMGAPQIMGFNHAAIGYDSARAMFDRFAADERFHILGLFDFIKRGARTSHMLEALRREAYEQFATHYNGPGQAAVYGARIRTAAEAFERMARRG